MPSTTNFNWTTPADTDLVKDGASAIRTLANGIDTSFVDLKGGTTGQVLSKATNTDLDFTWTTINGDITDVVAGTGLSGGGTSGSVTLSIDSTVATLTGSQTLTNKTLTSPLINTAVLKSPEERWTVSATAATGTINFNALDQGVLYYTTNSSANWTLNIRGDGSNTLNSILAVGDSLTVAFMVTNGTTSYYQTAFQIDGSSVTPKWSGGTAPSAGNASSIDVYTFTIVKTAATPTYTVFGAGPIKYA